VVDSHLLPSTGRCVAGGNAAAAQRLESASRATHAELLARIDRAAYFVLSSYAQRICLDEIAAARGGPRFTSCGSFAACTA